MLNIYSGNAELDEVEPWLVELTAGTQDGGKWPSKQAVKHAVGSKALGDRAAQERGMGSNMASESGKVPGVKGVRTEGGLCASVRPCLWVLGP